MRDHKNTKKMNFGINRNVMTLIGLLLLALGAMGRGIIQTRFLGVGAVNSDQLLEVLNASGGMQAAAAALVFEGLESCAAPIFAVLLIDGFQKNSIPALAPSATPPATWSKEISCRKMPEAWSMAAATMPKPSPDVFAAGPEIGYLSCHDDWTLWDRLINTMDEEKAYESNHAEAMRANRLAIALLIGCQGNLFILSGEESARTKEGIKNSFDSSIQVNRIDWNRIWENQELMKYYQGLFALRKKMPYLCDKSSDAARHIKRVYQPKDDCVAVELADHTTTGPWKKAIFLYNFSNKAQTIDLPEGQWQCLANGSDSFLWKKNLCQKATCTIQPMTAGIFGN